MKRIVIYSKRICPYCDRAKALLDSKGVTYQEIDVEAIPSARAEMQAKGGGRTVPQIFADDQYLGDCDHLHALDVESKLDSLLGIVPAPQSVAVESEVRRLIIIGSGPAGYTAGLYAARANLAPLLFSGMQPGGQLTITTDVENYPGFPKGIQGPDLMQLFREQAARFGAEIIDATVDAVDLKSAPKIVSVGKAEYRARTIIIATGASAKWLGIPGEDPAPKGYGGRGVSACATCDGFFFRGEDIAVAGGGDTALEEALYLTNFAKSVTVIHRRHEFRASRIMQDRVLRHPKIRVLWDTVVDEALGDGQKLTALKLRNVKTSVVSEGPFGGFFVAIGHQPNTSLFKGQLKLNEAGYIDASDPARMTTEIPGVFAAGDVRDSYYRQAVTAAGMGCMAAIEAERYLSEIESR
jgi:thioredoxin reductase (NADPH)